MEHQLKIERLGNLGNGIGEINDMDVFVPFSLPGETVSGEIIGDEMPKPRILAPSVNRVKPPCKHFKSCGGCALQHADDETVSAWKVEQVRRLLAMGNLSPKIRPIKTSPPRSRRRATFTVRRTKKGAAVGFFARGSDTLVEISECHVLEPALLNGFDGFRALAKLGASRKMPLRISATTSVNGLDLDVSDAKDLDINASAELGRIADQYGFARIRWNGEVMAQAAAPYQMIGQAQVTPPPDAFLQATKHGEMTLVNAALEITQGAKSLVDLFSGCGTFALNAAKFCAIHAVEGDAEMLRALDVGWRNAKGLKSVTHQTRDLFERPLLPDELSKFDAAIIDPPRAGAQSQTQALAQSSVEKIAFVSCYPATFARDAKILSTAGYDLEWVQVVDQFRWSPHVELVAAFHKR